MNQTTPLADTTSFGTTQHDTVVIDPPQTQYAQPAQPAQPAPAAQPTERTGDAFAITSFVLGIVSVVSGYFFVTPALGLVFGILAKRRTNTMPGLVNWGIGINAVILGFWLLLAGFAVTLGFLGLVGGAFWI